MNPKSALLTALAISIIAATFMACGSQTGSSPEKYLLLTLPSSLSSMSSQLVLEGELTANTTDATDKSSTANATPLLGAIQDDVITFALGETAEGPYVVKITAYYLSLNRAGRIAIAYQSYNVQVEKTWEVRLIEPPVDFKYDIDSDGDTMPNISEIQGGIDPSSTDTDGDGFPDALDSEPLRYQEDTDKDGTPDELDDDIDGDGLTNSEEETLGTNKSNIDSDGDAIDDKQDNCPLVSNADQLDTDEDGKGDHCVPDDDGDGIPDSDEINTYHTDPKFSDSDGDGLKDSFELSTLKTNPLIKDSDGDSIEDSNDNCPLHPNTGQQDLDMDKTGDACDSDIDGDGVANGFDNCPTVFNPDQTNTDKAYKDAGYEAPDNQEITADDLGDACDDEMDGDGLHVTYVDQANGNNNNLGTYIHPVTTLNRAISLAQSRGDRVYVAAGRYDLAGVTFPGAIELQGGYKAGFVSLNDRQLHDANATYKTALFNSGQPQTLVFKNITGRVEIAGFFVENSSTSLLCPLPGSSDAIEAVHIENVGQGYVMFKQNVVEFTGAGTYCTKGIAVYGLGDVELNSNLINGGDGKTNGIGVFIKENNTIIKNNVIVSGASSHTVGIKAVNASPIVVNNTIEGGKKNALVDSDGLNNRGIVFEAPEGTTATISPKIVNNAIFTHAQSADNDQDVLLCSSVNFLNATISSNIFTTFPNPPYGSRSLLSGCAAGGISYTPNPVIAGADVAGNLSYPKLEGDAPTGLDSFINIGTYRLLDLGPNQGVDASGQDYGFVAEDYNGNLRPVNNVYDIGAIEIN